MQPPVSEVVQSELHLTFASTVQEPEQLSWHSVVQSTLPGWTTHFSSHFVAQLAEHSDEQLSPLQLAMQPASQSVEQYSLQVKVAGWVVHSVSHLVWQVSVQVAEAVAMQLTSQVAVKESGVHCEVQPPAVSK